MKKASSRSQRGGSKGIKGKHVLQICVLLGVCIWLVYQVKYSHDKKKEFYEKDGEKSSELGREDGLVKLGRKDLLPGYHNNKNENEKRVEEDDDEEEVSHGGEEKEKKSKVENGEEEKEEEEEVVEEDEEDKNKQGEEVVEEDEEENKHEEDEIDEQDQSKNGGDGEKDDELLEEEKERGSNDEKEKENDRVDEIDMTVDEARDEHYKADDASSAVSHESRILKTENLKESSENSTETGRENDSNEVKIVKEPVLKLGEVESGGSVEKTPTEVKDGHGESSNAETKSAVTELTGEKVNGSSTEAILEASRVLQNETEIMQDRSQDHDKTEDGAPPAGFSNLQTVLEIEQTRNESNPNVTISANMTNQDESRNSTSESSLTESISSSNTTEAKENLGSEADDESGEKASSNLYSTEQTEEVDDTTETSISQEEREALIDPQTLPDIRIEGNEEDEEEALAAE